MKGKVTKVTLLTSISENNDRVKIEINGLDIYYAYGKYNDINSMLNQEVEFDVLQQGNETIIANIIEKQVIHKTDTRGVLPSLSIDKVEITDNTCNFDSRMAGIYCPGVITYVCSVEKKESVKAKWLDLVCLDINTKLFPLRYWITGIPDDQIPDLSNTLIKCNVEKTRYGLQVKDQLQIMQLEYQTSTETKTAALDIITSRLENDAILKAYTDKLKLIPKLSGIFYLTPGYHLVRMAAEINYIESICNIATNISKEDLTRLVFLSRAYLITDDSSLKSSVNNIYMLKLGGKEMATKDIVVALADKEDRIKENALSIAWDIVKTASKQTMELIGR